MLSFRKINLSNNYIFGLYKSPHEANRYYMNSFKSRKCAVTWGDKQKLVEVISLIRDKSIKSGNRKKKEKGKNSSRYTYRSSAENMVPPETCLFLPAMSTRPVINKYSLLTDRNSIFLVLIYEKHIMNEDHSSLPNNIQNNNLKIQRQIIPYDFHSFPLHCSMQCLILHFKMK